MAAFAVAALLHRLSLEDVYAMVRAGILEENERVELVDGVLVELNATGAEHRSIVKRLTKHRSPTSWSPRRRSRSRCPKRPCW